MEDFEKPKHKVVMSSITITSPPKQIALVYSKGKEDIEKVISHFNLEREPKEQTGGGYSAAFESNLSDEEMKKCFDDMGIEVLFKQRVIGQMTSKGTILH